MQRIGYVNYETRNMKKQLSSSLFIVFVFATIISSCKKSQSILPAILPAVQITEQENGKTVILSSGQTLKVTLGNPGDGGYSVDEPQYDSALLSLSGHIRNLPPVNAATGNFGSDTWEFKAKNQGQGALTITATRGADKTSTIVLFSGTVTVK